MNKEEWNARYDDPAVISWAGTPNRLLIAEVETLPPGRALDLACGAGRNAVWLAEHGWDVTGVDFADVAVRRARETASRHGVEIDFVVADLDDYEPPELGFDLVVVFFLQLLWPDMRRVLRKAARAVAPAGTFLLVGHDLLNLTEGWGGPSSAEVLYTPTDVASSLEGLEIQRAERYRRDVDGADRLAIDTVVRARRPALH